MIKIQWTFDCKVDETEPQQICGVVWQSTDSTPMLMVFSSTDVHSDDKAEGVKGELRRRDKVMAAGRDPILSRINVNVVLLPPSENASS